MNKGREKSLFASPASRRIRRAPTLPYLLLLPSVAFLCFFVFYPFVRSIYLTFFVTNSLGVPKTFVGWENYKRILFDHSFWNSMAQTFKFAGIVGTGTFVFAMILALMGVADVRGSKVYTTMYAIPMAIASVPLSALALFFLRNQGIINLVFGTSIEWLSTRPYALISVAFVTVWSGLGASFIFLLVGFRNVPDELIESSVIDGAGPLKRVFSVYIPVASPQIFFVAFLNIVGSFKAFGIIKLMTGKGPGDSTNIMVYAIYANAFIRNRFESACVYSLALCLIIFVITRIQLALEDRVVFYK